MRTITFNVIQQRIKPTNSTSFVYSGTDNYLNLEFSFDESWDDCVKGISFGSKKVAKLLEDNNVTVPAEGFDENELSFYLVGKKKNYRVQSQTFTIKLHKEVF